MYIDELRKYKENSYYVPEDIAEKLLILSNLNDESKETTKEDLTEALYQLKAIAENEYNKAYYRTLYNVLLTICGFEYF